MVVLEITNIIAGLLLASGLVNPLPFIGKHLNKITTTLGSFQVIIGGIALFLGMFNLGNHQGVWAFIAGLVLVAGLLPLIPAIGKSLSKITKTIGAFQAILGIVVIVVGVFGLV